VAKQYCCFGCRFAAAVTQARGEQGAANWTLTRLGLAIFLTINVMVFTMALWTQDFYGETASGSETVVPVLRGLFRYLCLLFAVPVLFLLGVPLAENACASLRRGVLNTDLLLVLGVAASYVYSAITVLTEEGAVYFEVGCVVLVLVTLGRWLEARGKLRTTAALESLHRLLPDEARLIRKDGEVRAPLGEIVVGDCLRVLPGERIACDGVLVRSTTMVDEQVLTGESQPVVKEPGDRVFGGSLNLDGELLLTVTAPAGGGALARLIALVERARQVKGHYERLADRVAAGFLPLVVLVALATLTWHASRHDLSSGILASLAVLLIACPCALGLATPMAIWAALGQAAQAQVLFQDGESLEKLASARAIRLDKTGTLTTGSPTVSEFVPAPGVARHAILTYAACLATASTHSYAAAIRQFAEKELVHRMTGESLSGLRGPFLETRTLPGRGLVALLPTGMRAYLGSPRLMEQVGLATPPTLSAVISRNLQAGQPLSCIGYEGEVRGVFVFHEQLRPEAIRALASLRDLGLDVAILTGDSAARGSLLGRELGVSVAAGLLPADKVTAIRAARSTAGPVAMVGDGVNDAPALAAADVGLAMGCGADVTRDAAAVCLLGNDLLRLPWAIILARRSVRVIRQNLFWAFVYNFVGIAFACTGRLNPVLAALAMVLSSTLVVTNSLRLGECPNSAEESALEPSAPSFEICNPQPTIERGGTP
jgi:heavy metal translocating P-type ATPase